MTLDLTNWMSRIASLLKLSDLSIPGTHDSGARAPASDAARLTTQTRTVREQLEDGIRFIDIRVKYRDNNFQLYHENTPLRTGPEADAGPLYFGSNGVLGVCRRFLAAHPRETIIMSVKQESSPEGNNPNVNFQQRFNQYVAEDDNLWFLENRIPTLAQARGKIVLFRRFSIASGTVLGINAEGFQNNATFTINGPPRLIVQDKYSQAAATREDKWTAVRDLLNEASGPGLCVVFCSFRKRLFETVPSAGETRAAKPRR